MKVRVHFRATKSASSKLSVLPQMCYSSRPFPWKSGRAFGRLETTTIEPRLSQQLALSLLWILYSSVHIVLGVQRGSAALRRQGLALIGVVVLKAFLIDISFLERGYRILSFLVLGLVLMFVSFLYQKHFGRHAEQ